MFSILNFQLSGFRFFFNLFHGFNLGFSKSIFSFFLDFFHNFNCCLLLLVIFFVMFFFFFLFFSTFYFKLDGAEYRLGEFLCSILPVLILFFQMLPSLYLLYFFGLLGYCYDLSLKVVGHQWYWSYSYSDFDFIDFDSYCKFLDSFDYGDFRCLDVDNRCVLPCDVSICFCLTSADVIHSWTIFNLGVKLDAISGVLSSFNFSFPVVGVYFGQCSEICGVNHSFMPIVLEVTLFSLFKLWCFSFF